MSMTNTEGAKTRLGFSYIKTRVKKQAEYFIYASYFAIAIAITVIVLTELTFPNFILQDGLWADWTKAMSSQKPFYSHVAKQYVDPDVIRGALTVEILNSVMFSIFYFFAIFATSFAVVFPIYNKIMKRAVSGLTDDKVKRGTEILKDDKFLDTYKKLQDTENDSLTLTKIYSYEEVKRK